jgi:cephalosporin-C deacetylase-like acetyl esterase
MKKSQALTIPRTILFIAIILLKINTAFAQEENLNVFERWRAWSDGENMLMRHLNKQAFTYLDIRDKEIAALQTKADWQSRQKKVKETLIKTVGPFPEKTPLNPQITGIIKKEGYKIDNVIYESMPGFYVTGSLFLPDGNGKKPAILFTSGHAQNSFRHESYQFMILNLVKKGFIVFAIDPISQGERVQLFDPEKNASAIGPTTLEHNYLGNKTLLSGVSLARYFIWDGIRAVDYLLTRKEVDSERIGVTGQSGGGTQAAYIFAFDDRVKAGAPVNYITGFRRLLESIGPQDAEQNFYHGIMNGLTHADLLEVRAPNPALICAGTRDFFSIQGAREAYAEISKAYKAFGKEENIGMVEDDFGHGYTEKLREGIYDFFQKNLNLTGNPGDENVAILAPEELMVTRTGNVASSIEKAQTVFDLNKKEAQKQIESLQDARKNIAIHLNKVQQEAKKLSGYRPPDENIQSVFRGRYQREGYSVEMYALHGEGECIIPLLLFIPETGNNFSSIIYLHPKGKITDAATGGRIEELVKKGYLVAAPDVSGIGEVKDDNYGTNYLALLIGRSIVGIQAGDVNRVVNFLKQRPDVDPEKLGAVAFDELGPTLLHAAAFDKSISSVTLIDPLISYQTIIENKFYNTTLTNSFVAGALTAYDLPDLAAILSPAKLNLINIRDGEKKCIDADIKNSDIEFIKTAWHEKNASSQLHIVKENSAETMFKEFLKYIE